MSDLSRMNQAEFLRELNESHEFAKRQSRIIIELRAKCERLESACRTAADELDRWSKETGGIIWMTPPRQLEAVHESVNERLRGAIEESSN